MIEMVINDNVYQFSFGMGFLRDVNRIIKAPIDGVPGAQKNVGMRFMMASLIDHEPEALAEVLKLANKGFLPRLTDKEIDLHLDNPDTDIDKLFDDVKDFLLNSNATKNDARQVVEAIEKEKRRQNRLEMGQLALEATEQRQ